MLRMLAWEPQLEELLHTCAMASKLRGEWWVREEPNPTEPYLAL